MAEFVLLDLCIQRVKETVVGVSTRIGTGRVVLGGGCLTVSVAVSGACCSFRRQAWRWRLEQAHLENRVCGGSSYCWFKPGQQEPAMPAACNAVTTSNTNAAPHVRRSSWMHLVDAHPLPLGLAASRCFTLV